MGKQILQEMSSYYQISVNEIKIREKFGCAYFSLYVQISTTEGPFWGLSHGFCLP